LLLCGAAGVVSAGGCQQILGIHGSQLGQSGSDGGAAGGATGGGRGGDAGGPGTGGTISGGTGGVVGAGGSGGVSMTGGASGGRSGGGSGGSTGGDTGRGGATGGATGHGGGGSAGGGSAGSAACTPPWHAEGVQARILTPNTAMTACSFAAADVPSLAAGVDSTTYRGALACGACLRVQASLGPTSVVVQVVELSQTSGVLLSKAAMDTIAPGASLTTVDWTLVACDVQNQPVKYVIKDGSNAGYVGVQIRNARYPVASVAAVGTNTSVPLTLQTYAYWESTSAGAGPLTLRLTDVNGQSFLDSGVKITPQAVEAGHGQFPLCF
jgi:hypothetical protein